MSAYNTWIFDASWCHRPECNGACKTLASKTDSRSLWLHTWTLYSWNPFQSNSSKFSDWRLWLWDFTCPRIARLSRDSAWWRGSTAPRWMFYNSFGVWREESVIPSHLMGNDVTDKWRTKGRKERSSGLTFLWIIAVTFSRCVCCLIETIPLHNLEDMWKLLTITTDLIVLISPIMRFYKMYGIPI